MNSLEKERIVCKNLIELFRESFNSEKSDIEILNSDPDTECKEKANEYYESISDIFFIEPDLKYKLKGKVKNTVKRVTKMWNTTPYSLTF